MGAIEGTTYRSVDGGPRLRRSVIQERSMHGSAIHPTEKPIALLKLLVHYAATPGTLLVDPFAGSGSLLETAQSLGHPAIGVEAHEPYCERIARRLEAIIGAAA